MSSFAICWDCYKIVCILFRFGRSGGTKALMLLGERNAHRARHSKVGVRSSMPGGPNPAQALVDVAHTFHIKGVGCDFAASAVVLMCRKGLFGCQKLDDCIYNAYAVYMEYCHTNRKKSACRPWTSKLAFDMSKVNSFPTDISGKGFDTSVVCGWISAFLDNQETC